ncbi:hypothetical protein HDU86_006703 [Geranomyces michiganensis]|nr:hypothetical protein HDU86_006703 [Geranomyces michiganensis]
MIFGAIMKGSFLNQHQARKFVAAGLRVDPEELLFQLGQDDGLKLLGKLQEEAMSVTAGNRKAPYSFQRVILPLLAMLLSLPDLYDRKLRRIYAIFFENNAFIDNLLQCASDLLGRRSVVDAVYVPSTDDRDIANTFQLENWSEMMLLITKFLIRYLRMDTDAVAEQRFKNWLARLSSISEGWEKDAPGNVTEAAKKELRNSNMHIKDMMLPEEAKRLAPPPRLREKPRGTLYAEQHGPGDLHPNGPRHDNDKADFRHISIIPTFGETFSTIPPFLPVTGGQSHLPNGVDQYLDAQFRLVREDLLASLRRGIAGFVQGGTKALKKLGEHGTFYRLETGSASQDLVMFRHAEVVSVKCSLRSGISLQVSFDEPARAKADSAFWGKGAGGKMLQKGSIVVLWLGVTKDVSDDTTIAKRQIYLAKVVDREQKALSPRANDGRPTVGLQLLEFKDLLKVSTQNLGYAEHANENIMFQVKGHFFNAGDSVLRTLQKFRTEDFPFADTIVFDEPVSPPPAYLLPGTTFDLSSLVKNGHGLSNVEVSDYKQLVQTLRVTPGLLLDETQILAFASALTHAVALIQGPPGCGKTYIGVHIVKALIRNADKISAGREALQAEDAARRLRANVQRIAGAGGALSATFPLLCVTYTNHALDSFLEDLIKGGVSEEDVIRIGGRSQSEQLASRNLSVLSHRSKTPEEHRRAKALEAEATDLEAQIQEFNRMQTLSIHQWRLSDLDVLFDEQVEAIKEGAFLCLAGDDEFQIVTGGRRESKDPLQKWLRGDDVQHGFEQEVAPTSHVSSVVTSTGLFNVLSEDYGSNVDGFDDGSSEDGVGNGKASVEPAEEPDARNVAVIADRPLDELVQDMAVWDMTVAERHTLMNYWRRFCLDILGTQFETNCRRYEEKKAEYDDIVGAAQLRILRKCKVLGVTTSGAAMHMKLLHNLAPSIIVCEEAGEVLEAHLISSLSVSASHLIQIGDEKQLRPSIEEHSLSSDSDTGYTLDISLFERLVKRIEAVPNARNEGLIAQLSTQWRMRPEISMLLKHTLYPALEDASGVLNYPKVKGMRHNVFFLDHNHQEGGKNGEHGAETARSKLNLSEAQLVVALVKHLIRQGYAQSEIAVLTPYAGQLLCLRDLLKKEQLALYIDGKNLKDLNKVLAGEVELDDVGSDNEGEVDEPAQGIKNVVAVRLGDRVRLSTVDNFQGEEANVVVISTVRCNTSGRTGFLKIDNRVNVMVSRAKHGQYIFGSASTIRRSQAPTMFKKVVQLLDEQGRLGTALPLQCARHPETIMSASTAAEIRQLAPDGGCGLDCRATLPCGHVQSLSLRSSMFGAMQQLLGKLSLDVYPWLRFLRVCGEPCPPASIACPMCAKARFKNSQVDMIMMTDLVDHDPDDEPLITLPCDHSFTLSTMDGIMRLQEYYERDASIGQWVQPLPINDGDPTATPSCPHCRSPISGIRRYGRVLNHAFLDQTVRKFDIQTTAYASQLEEVTQALDIKLERWRADAEAELALAQPRFSSLNALWEKDKKLRTVAQKHRNVAESLVQDADREHPVRRTFEKSISSLTMINNIPGTTHHLDPETARSQIRHLQAHHSRPNKTAFLIAAVAFLNSGSVSVKQNVNHVVRLSFPPAKPKAAASPVNFTTQLNVIKAQFDAASALHSKAQEICAETSSRRTSTRAYRANFLRIFLSLESLVTLRRLPASDESKLCLEELIGDMHGHLKAGATDYLEHSPDHGEQTTIATSLARADELVLGEFYQPVSKEEKLAIFTAMGHDVGTGVGSFGGHWYTCPNGHVYTIGECGGAMQTSTCPECGATVGGGSHRINDDNRVATEFLREVGGPVVA